MVPPDAGITAWAKIVAEFGFGGIACWILWFKILPILDHLCEFQKEQTTVLQGQTKVLEGLADIVKGRRVYDESVDLESGSRVVYDDTERWSDHMGSEGPSGTGFNHPPTRRRSRRRS